MIDNATYVSELRSCCDRALVVCLSKCEADKMNHSEDMWDTHRQRHRLLVWVNWLHFCYIFEYVLCWAESPTLLSVKLQTVPHWVCFFPTIFFFKTVSLLPNKGKRQNSSCVSTIILYVSFRSGEKLAFSRPTFPGFVPRCLTTSSSEALDHRDDQHPIPAKGTQLLHAQWPSRKRVPLLSKMGEKGEKK